MHKKGDIIKYNNRSYEILEVYQVGEITYYRISDKESVSSTLIKKQRNVVKDDLIDNDNKDE